MNMKFLLHILLSIFILIGLTVLKTEIIEIKIIFMLLMLVAFNLGYMKGNK